jgi:hypothetical protein
MRSRGVTDGSALSGARFSYPSATALTRSGKTLLSGRSSYTTIRAIHSLGAGYRSGYVVTLSLSAGGGYGRSFSMHATYNTESDFVLYVAGSASRGLYVVRGQVSASSRRAGSGSANVKKLVSTSSSTMSVAALNDGRVLYTRSGYSYPYTFYSADVLGSAASTDDDTSGAATSLVVGIVVGAIILVVIIALCAYCCCCRSAPPVQNAADATKVEEPTAPFGAVNEPVMMMRTDDVLMAEMGGGAAQPQWGQAPDVDPAMILLAGAAAGGAAAMGMGGAQQQEQGKHMWAQPLPPPVQRMPVDPAIRWGGAVAPAHGMAL